MDNQKSPEPGEPARAGYNAPRAQRLNDIAPARGADCVPGNAADPGQCAGNGSAAENTCVNGGVAEGCLSNGNVATATCNSGNDATECSNYGNGAI